MNKDLEKEYKELMTEDVPDLWGRIEAGLEPKKPAAKVSFWRKYRTWGMAAAACLCLTVVAPMIYNGVSSDSTSKSDSGGDSGGAAYAPSIMDNMSEGSMYEYNGGDGFSPQENYEADWGDVNSAGEASNSGYDDVFYLVTAIVTEVLDEGEEWGKVYCVQLLETELTDWAEGDIIKLYDRGLLDEELMEGETYLLAIVPLETDDDTEEYYIYDFMRK